MTVERLIQPEHGEAFRRQIRRYVHAPLHQIAAIVPPEFSALCQQEIADLGIEGSLITEAGVEFSGKLASCYLTNLWLRTASRVLCRVDYFRAGAIEQLFKRAFSFRWELWLNPDIPLRIEAHLKSSRIEHQGLVEETLLTAAQKRFVAVDLAGPAEYRKDRNHSHDTSTVLQKVIVRIENNRCQISLDSSGTHLHQRGYRRRHTGAPLRETVAAAILLKAGWRGDTPLIDGMSGAGTVAIEASLVSRRLPPGNNRPFLFQQWPAFQQKTWEHLLRRAREGALTCAPVPIIAVDNDPEAMAIAKENAKSAGVEQDIVWQNEDFFSLRPQAMSVRSGLLFLNPPYGKRLEGATNLFQRLGQHLHRFYRDWRVAIIVPDRKHAMQLNLESARYWQIRHGGMPVVAVLARIQ